MRGLYRLNHKGTPPYLVQLNEKWCIALLANPKAIRSLPVCIGRSKANIRSKANLTKIFVFILYFYCNLYSFYSKSPFIYIDAKPIKKFRKFWRIFKKVPSFFQKFVSKRFSNSWLCLVHISAVRRRYRKMYLFSGGQAQCCQRL